MLSVDTFVTFAMALLTKKKPLSTSWLFGSISQKGAGSISDASSRWITSLATNIDSDLIIGGSADGIIRILNDKNTQENRDGSLIVSKYISLRGYVNGIALAGSRRFFAAAVGQEPRLDHHPKDLIAKNGLVIK